MFSLEDLGWGPFFREQTAQLNTEDPSTTAIVALGTGFYPMRVAEEQRSVYVLWGEAGAFDATLPGRWLHEAEGRDQLPAVGDWVLARPLPGEDRAVIEQLLGRRTALSRKAAGVRTNEQIIAANVDLIFVVASLNRELNLRRIERYLAVAWETGATPVLVLNKADLAEDGDALLREVHDVAPGVEAIETSAVTGEGIEALNIALKYGQTAVFIGSSGVGKSSLVNRLLGNEAQAVSHIRSDDKGRHTTTSRQMLVAPGGAVIIDTPGIRELQLWDAGEGLGQAFSEVETLAAGCAFRDCTHTSEPGCAIMGALRAGELDRRRLESYRKLEREQQFIESKKDDRLRSEQKKKWKQIHVDNRRRMKMRGR
ncbi:MAG TPA: ribosome small subunit-dependent GTPase A [Dehalococcoidia bacterium]|nr:ribosome small subunit-dependent GTPase A [Dehalococcoidia bacterium]